MGSEEVDVDVAGYAMPFEFEMMMFEVGQTVRHVFFASLDCLPPYRFTITLDADVAGDGTKIAAHNQLRADAALAQLGAGEIEIVLALELVIGKLIAGAH